MGQYFIGVDSGTQGTKAVVMDGATGKIKSTATAAYGLLPNLKGGAKEQHPKVWVAALEKTIREAVAAAKVKPSEVKGIGISGQQHGFVPLDEKGTVIRPAKLWCDTSTLDEAETILGRLGGLDSCLTLTGNGLPVGFTASKILWMKQAEPKNYARLATVLLPHDYLNFHLTGKARMEAGDASGTGLFNTRTRNWEARCVDAIDPDLATKLPPIDTTSSQPAGELLASVAARIGLEPGILVSAGGGDNMMGAIGTGNTKIGVVTASLGTSGTIYAYSSRPVIDPRGEVAAFCDSAGGWLPLICTMNVTVATELVKKAFRWDNDKLTTEAGKIPAGSEGLMLLPYFEGERVPNLPLASGVYFGFKSHNFSPAHMARATMEGVSLGLNYGLDRLKDLGLRPKQIRVTGGGSKNPLWRQILADTFDAEVTGLTTSEGAACGAAIQAKWSFMLHRGERVRIQQITDAFVKVDPATRCQPRKANTKLYRSLQEVHNRFSRALAPVFHDHAKLG
ncbi:MAG: xylulokinase [Candidatus Methylacidiphilales bacterium]|nr:xylulokinase [Candidatus Methylacidiphilales bacterium]